MNEIVYGTDVVFDYAVLMTDILGKSKKARYMRAFLLFNWYINRRYRCIYRSKATV